MKYILVAMESEAAYLTCPEERIILTGIGVQNIIATLGALLDAKKIKRTDTFLNVGYAGSCRYHIGEVLSIAHVDKFIKPKVIEEESFDLDPLTPYHTLCYTFDDFAENVDCEGVMDMELFYLACFFPNLHALKIVSDNGNYAQYERFDADAAWAEANKVIHSFWGK